MQNKILITGCHGQLGTALMKLLPDAIGTDVEELDITDFGAVQAFVLKNGIDTIVNCAAYTAVDRAEEQPDFAGRINVLGPENLAKTGCKMIHISTDYVFDGKGCVPYQPEDETHPLSVYGMTKRAGEQAVLQYASAAVVIRTAWLYSETGKNFVKTMLKLGAEKEDIGVVADQVGSPTYASDLAKAIVQIIPQLTKETAGIYHFTNEGVCSWYDFATEIMTMAGLKCCVRPLTTAEYPTKAVRPAYSVLDKSKIKKTFGVSIRQWRQALNECLNKLQNSK